MIRLFKRWYFIWSIIANYRLIEMSPNLARKRWLRILLWLTPQRTPLPLNNNANEYERLRAAMEALGPIFVKFGQALSTRPDLLPVELAKELSQLQDNVQPFPQKQAIAIIERSLGNTVSKLFSQFDEQALASASIAQVHTAKLPSGEDIIVKVVRPGIAEVIKRDVQSLHILASVINTVARDLRRLRLPELVAEFAHTLNDELDLRQEAANASKLRANFPDSPAIYVPKIYWDYSRKDVMVMERIFATPISDLDSIKAHGVNMEKLASLGVEIFFTQVFTHKYFHADMHPGNIFVDISDPENPRYKAIDFGIMGTLSDADQYYLAENFLAFFNRDYYRVAKLHIDSGWVPSHVNVHEFESAIRKVGEPIFGKPLAEISFGEFLITLIQVARRFDMIVQPQLLLLQKTVLNVEGLGRVLYPQLDLWATAKPILEQWTKETYGLRAFAKQLRGSAGDYRDVIPKLPHLIDQQLQKPAPQPSALSKKIPTAIVLSTLLVIVAIPDVWQAQVLKPLAICGIAFCAYSLFTKR